jgi:hypothetical protein
MSARIVVNLAHGLAESAIDHGSDGGTWLSFQQGRELVLVKLSTPSLQTLWLTLTRELGMVAPEEMASGVSPGPEEAPAATVERTTPPAPPTGQR